MFKAKTLGPVRATFLVAGNMIGSGVYLLPATLGSFGSVSVIGWVITGIGAFLLAGVFVMLFRVKPDSVGMVRQIRDGLGHFFGFHASLLYWVAGWVGNVAVALAATGYLSIFFPALNGPLPTALCTLAVIWLMTLINFMGVRRVADFEGATLLVGLLPVLGVAVLGWFAFDPVIFRESWNVSGQSDVRVIPATFALIFWAFVGVESASVAGALVRNPARDVPIATLGGVALAASVYLAASIAIDGLLPAATLAASSAPFADAAARWVGPAAAAVVAACAVLKALGTLSGWLLVTAESARSGAESGVFPAFFREASTTHARRNLLIVSGLMSVIVILSSMAPTLAAEFTVLINLATLLYLVIYAYCCAALWRFTRNSAMRLIAALTAGFCVWAVAASDMQQLIYLAAVCAVGALLYLWMQNGRRGSGLSNDQQTDRA
ncbi:MAG: amino acid permease [Gammaproteobacteria bacterium]